MRDQAKTKNQLIAELRDLRASLAAAQPPPAQVAAVSPVFRQVFAQAALGMALVSPQGRFLQVNRHLCEMLGYSEHELCALDITRLTHPEDLPATRRHLANLPRGPRVVQQERRFLHRYGHSLWVLVKSTLVQDHQGRLEYLISLYMDITQQKAAEAALSESEEKYRTIFETAGSAMVIMEEDTTILLANTEFARLTGTRKEDLNGKASWTQFIAPHDVERMVAYHRLRRVDPGAAPRAYEAQVIGGLGRLRDCLVTVAVLPGTRRSVASLLDLTERKQLEAQLRQSQKMEAIGTLAGGVAHDFNNILASILGYAEIALHDFLEPGHLAAGPLEEVISAGKRARDLADQILTFSRRGGEERLPLALAPVVKEALKLLRASLPAFVEISAPIDGRAGMVLADPTQMHQVVINLCANAAQAMGRAGGRLVVGLERRDLDQEATSGLAGLEPGPHVCLSVGDSGQGMAPEVLERVFEPYYTTKGPGEGTGLGLAVVHGIVKSHRGAIRVSSSPGRGSLFQVYFPLAQGQALEPPPAPGRVPRGRERVLLVDDEPAVASMASTMLTNLGYQVRAFTDSLEALEAFGQDPGAFDLLLTDQTMPRLTGSELAQRILELRPDLPVILCSGHGPALGPEEARALGIRQILKKPIPRRELALALRQALAGED